MHVAVKFDRFPLWMEDYVLLHNFVSHAATLWKMTQVICVSVFLCILGVSCCLCVLHDPLCLVNPCNWCNLWWMVASLELHLHHSFPNLKLTTSSTFPPEPDTIPCRRSFQPDLTQSLVTQLGN